MSITLTQPREGAAEYQTIMGLVGTFKGLSAWSAPIDHIAFDSDSRYAHVIQNQGTGGALHLKASGGGTLLTAADSGVTIPTLSVTTLTATTANITTANITTGNITTANVTTLGVTGNTTLGNENTDALTVVGVSTFRNAASSATQLYVDPGNNRVIVGSASAMGSDTTPNLQVLGRLYVAPESANDTALQLRRSTAATVGWTMGVESTNDLILKDDSDTSIARFGDAGSTWQFQVITGDAKIQDLLAAGGGVVIGADAMSGSEELRVVGQSRIEGNLTGTTGTFDWQNSGNSRAKFDSTGCGFFGATPIARPTVTGTRTGTLAQLQAVVASLLSALDGSHLGLITDSTS